MYLLHWSAWHVWPNDCILKQIAISIRIVCPASAMRCHVYYVWRTQHVHEKTNLPLSLFLCRVRTAKKSLRKTRWRTRTGSPKRKCVAFTAMGIIWCQVPSPVVPRARCAARRCRKSMACSARVSNTTATGVHAPTLLLSQTHMCTGAALMHKLASIYTACTLTRPLSGALMHTGKQTTHTCTYNTKSLCSLNTRSASLHWHLCQSTYMESDSSFHHPSQWLWLLFGAVEDILPFPSLVRC